MPRYSGLIAAGLLAVLFLPAHACLPQVLRAQAIFDHHPATMSTHIYKGRYTNSSDILYTWDGEHLYRGRYTNSSDVLYTWDGKHLYSGRYTSSSDILYTWDGRHLYKGRYTNSSDIVLTVDGSVPAWLLVVVT